MASRSKRPELVAIVGPTASGKTDLAIKVAKQFSGEIIAADSRTLYQNMDIGTAKPSNAQRQQVPHWGLDLVEPGERFTAFEFQQYASSKINDILRRQRLPILVGGSGLYIDAVIFDYGFVAQAGNSPTNPRHRLSGSYPKNKTLRGGVVMISLNPDKDELKRRITKRAKAIFQANVIGETKLLVDKYGEGKVTRTAGLVYKICLKVLNQEISQDEALKLFETADWQYARRQLTWFKRNQHINWFSDKTDALEFIESQLSK